ncbi:MAG: hypothetical protein ISR58_08375 [Anaerolineales bacterium]|nr:hypothetical protein [Chloroflexota bacterium]MBL6981194.1 hypothetical protein [Anaerolineales bacterium]
MTESSTLYCTNHPNKETSLRCNRCEKLICSKCAIHTPTGYRCKDCVRTQQKIFNSAEFYDYPLGFIIAAVLSYIGSLIASRFGFFVLFLAPLAGMGIAEVTRLITRRRRSKYLFYTIAAGTLLGALPSVIGPILALLFFGPEFGSVFGIIFSLIWDIAYAIIVTSTVYYRISGLTFNR